MNTTKITSKGQVTIPVELRKQFGLENGQEVIFMPDDNGNLVMKKVPTLEDWDKITANIPVEHIEFDENGHYDPKKHPEFDEWVREG